MPDYCQEVVSTIRWTIVNLQNQNMRLSTAIKRLESILVNRDDFEDVIADAAYKLHSFFTELPDVICIKLNDCLITTEENLVFILDLLYETRRTGWYEAVLFIPNFDIFPSEKDRLFVAEYIAKTLKLQIPELDMLRVKFFSLKESCWWASNFYKKMSEGSQSIIENYIRCLNSKVFTPNYSQCSGCEFNTICDRKHLHLYSLCRRNKVREEIEKGIQSEIKNEPWLVGASSKIVKSIPVNQNEQFV